MFKEKCLYINNKTQLYLMSAKSFVFFFFLRSLCSDDTISAIFVPKLIWEEGCQVPRGRCGGGPWRGQGPLWLAPQSILFLQEN